MCKKVLTITTNWNDSKRTLRCLKSLINCSYADFDIMILDNDSKSEDFKNLKKEILRIISKLDFNFYFLKKLDYKKRIKGNPNKKNLFLIKIPFNSGCTGGYNIGYYLGNKSKYKYISRIDNDCTVKKNYLEKLVTFLDKNPDYVGVNSKVCYLQNKKKIQWVGAKYRLNLLINKSTRIYKKVKLNQNFENNLSKNWKGFIETDTLNGPGSLIRSVAFEKIGYSDPNFFFGPEDMDLSDRLKKIGKIIVNLDSEIYHEVAQSASITGISKRTYYEYKSHLYLLKKIYSYPIFLASLLIFMIGIVYNILIFALFFKKDFFLKVNIKYKALKDILRMKLGVYDMINLNENHKIKFIKEYLKIFYV